MSADRHIKKKFTTQGSTERPSEWIRARSLNSYFAFCKIVVKIPYYAVSKQSLSSYENSSFGSIGNKSLCLFHHNTLSSNKNVSCVNPQHQFRIYISSRPLSSTLPASTSSEENNCYFEVIMKRTVYKNSSVWNQWLHRAAMSTNFVTGNILYIAICYFYYTIAKMAPRYCVIRFVGKLLWGFARREHDWLFHASLSC